MNLLFVLLLVLLILALLGGVSWHQGYWGTPGPYYYGYSPFALILVILLILWALGYLR